MPYYLFSHPETKDIREVFFHMKDDKVYVDELGVTWKREWTKPTMSVDVVKINPYKAKDFVKYTANKKGTYGSLLQISKEMSEQRAAENGGRDPILQQTYDQYAKERGGKRHPDEIKRDAKEALDKKGIEIEF